MTESGRPPLEERSFWKFLEASRSFSNKGGASLRDRTNRRPSCLFCLLSCNFAYFLKGGSFSSFLEKKKRKAMKVIIKSKPFFPSLLAITSCTCLPAYSFLLLLILLSSILTDWTGVATWKWIANDDNCGICRNAFDGVCTDCKMPGDDCPLGNDRLRQKHNKRSNLYTQSNNTFTFLASQSGANVRTAFIYIAS